MKEKLKLLMIVTGILTAASTFAQPGHDSGPATDGPIIAVSTDPQGIDVKIYQKAYQTCYLQKMEEVLTTLYGRSIQLPNVAKGYTDDFASPEVMSNYFGNHFQVSSQDSSDIAILPTDAISVKPDYGRTTVNDYIFRVGSGNQYGWDRVNNISVEGFMIEWSPIYPISQASGYLNLIAPNYPQIQFDRTTQYQYGDLGQVISSSVRLTNIHLVYPTGKPPANMTAVETINFATGMKTQLTMNAQKFIDCVKAGISQ